MHLFDAIDAELKEWRNIALRPVFWIRDDDVVDDTPALHRLLKIAQSFEIAIAFAVIPSRVSPDLVKVFRGSRYCVAWQHGNRHVWSDTEEGFSAGEFGIGRTIDALIDEAVAGHQAMDHAFGVGHWENVFVPPFHALNPTFKALLPAIGFKGLSAGNPPTPKLVTMKEVNAPIDLINWKKRGFAGSAEVVAQIVKELRRRRCDESETPEPLGILTHHLDFDEECWLFLKKLLSHVAQSDYCDLISASTLFADSASLEEPSRLAADVDSVALIITSCGRQDLLETTLRSFIAVNEFPLKEIIVVEDGDGSLNDQLKIIFREHDILWLETGMRVGQINAIDFAYSHCTSDYILHCEDDWEFYHGGFIDKSLILLKHHSWLLQVWLRSLLDTNKHPLLRHAFETESVPFRLLAHNHDAGAWGEWHGLSWNPGLRRRADYDAIGTFSSLDPTGIKESWRVESEASIFYKDRGLLAAILATNDGEGYVRHVGKNRRVARDFLKATTECGQR
jgi:hypothetical protein